MAVGLDSGLDGGQGVLHLGLDVVIGAVAVGLGLPDGHGVGGQLPDSLVTQELIPGDVALVGDLQQQLGGVVQVLLIQGLAGVQAVVAGVGDAVVQALIVVVHLGRGVVLAADGDGVGIAVEHAGVHQQQHHGHHHEQHGDAAVQTVGLALLGFFLRLTDGLGILDTLAGQLLTGLLFS